jgi:hypothetical protein
VRSAPATEVDDRIEKLPVRFCEKLDGLPSFLRDRSVDCSTHDQNSARTARSEWV